MMVFLSNGSISEGSGLLEALRAEEVKGLIGLLLVVLLDAVLLVDLVELVEEVVQALLEFFVVLLGEGFLVDALEDLLLLGHELVQPAIASSLRDGLVVVLLGVDLPEHVLEDGLGLLSKLLSTYCSDSIAIFSLFAIRGSECETVLI